MFKHRDEKFIFYLWTSKYNFVFEFFWCVTNVCFCKKLRIIIILRVSQEEMCLLWFVVDINLFLNFSHPFQWSLSQNGKIVEISIIYNPNLVTENFDSIKQKCATNEKTNTKFTGFIWFLFWRWKHIFLLLFLCVVFFSKSGERNENKILFAKNFKKFRRSFSTTFFTLLLSEQSVTKRNLITHAQLLAFCN